MAVFGQIGEKSKHWSDRNFLVDDCFKCSITQKRSMPNDVDASHHCIKSCFVTTTMSCHAHTEIMGGITNNLQFVSCPNLNFSRTRRDGSCYVNLDDVCAFFDLAAHSQNHFFFITNNFCIASCSRVGNEFPSSATHSSHQCVTSRAHCWSFDNAGIDGVAKCWPNIENAIDIEH